MGDHITLCGEACVDEIAHLPAIEAGKALAHAIHFACIGFEREHGDAAVFAFLSEIEKLCGEHRERMKSYAEKEAAGAV